ncbi:Helix-turn-helix domain protein [Anatilimnocola aggregata]|uniref:Helix-turn-helix domain protein n=1 Tax=Anatilimnocola aggregata TaxID=2528021 RepID=A0A517Y6P6_9BACT|nr:helix-turn-helix domain-containing protein [Anatilimnocola aggregata]QDU25886.1 Helix-turn-helix domain protein [Anatilimnocola aggregata]
MNRHLLPPRQQLPEPTKPEPLLIDGLDAGDLLGISIRTINRLVAEGAIPCRRIGRLTRYCPNELRAWIAAGCPRPGQRVTTAQGGAK